MFFPVFIPVRHDVHHYDSYSHHESGPKYKYKEKLVVSKSFKNVIFTFKLKPVPPPKPDNHSWLWHFFHDPPAPPHYEEEVYAYYDFIAKEEVEKMVADPAYALKWVKQKVKETEDDKDRYSDYTGFDKAYSAHYEGIDPEHLHLKDMKLLLDKYELTSVYDDGFDSWYEKDTSERVVEEW